MDFDPGWIFHLTLVIADVTRLSLSYGKIIPSIAAIGRKGWEGRRL